MYFSAISMKRVLSYVVRSFFFKYFFEKKMLLASKKSGARSAGFFIFYFSSQNKIFCSRPRFFLFKNGILFGAALTLFYLSVLASCYTLMHLLVLLYLSLSRCPSYKWLESSLVRLNMNAKREHLLAHDTTTLFFCFMCYYLNN